MKICSHAGMCNSRSCVCREPHETHPLCNGGHCMQMDARVQCIDMAEQPVEIRYLNDRLVCSMPVGTKIYDRTMTVTPRGTDYVAEIIKKEIRSGGGGSPITTVTTRWLRTKEKQSDEYTSWPRIDGSPPDNWHTDYFIKEIAETKPEDKTDYLRKIKEMNRESNIMQ